MKRAAEPKIVSIAEAAAALEAEVLRFHEATEAARRLPLKTQKQVARAAQVVDDAVRVQALVAERLQALGAALADGTTLHGADLESLRATSESVRERHDRIGQLLARFSELGVEAKEVQESLRVEAPEGVAPVVDFDACARRLASVAERARELQSDALALEVDDLAREADGMRQQLLALVNRLRLAGQEHKARTGDGT
jgi:hypothetical protein